MQTRNSFRPLSWLPLLGILLSIASCSEPVAGASPQKQGKATLQKPPVICILPLGKSKPALAGNTAKELQKVFPDVRLLPAEPLPSFAWHRSNKRWRADSLIRWMSGRAKTGEVWIGVTSEDISTTKGPYSDYGIMGLGFRPGRACVASERRLKEKANFQKVVIHELGHTAGLDHCPSNRCLMQAANGKDHTGELDAFCPKCHRFLVDKGWVLP